MPRLTLEGVPEMVADDGTTTGETYPQTRKFDGGFTGSSCTARRAEAAAPPEEQPPKTTEH
jgi:hypothetical protein